MITDSLIICVGTTVLFLVFNFLVFAGPSSTLDFYIKIYTDAFSTQGAGEILSQNLHDLHSFLGEVFNRRMNVPLLQVVLDTTSTTLIALAGIGLFVMIKNKTGRFSLLFLFWVCMLLLVTPGFQGVRYFLPAIPVFILLVAKGIGYVYPLVTKLSPKYVAIVCSIICLISGYDYYEYSSRVKEWSVTKQDHEAFDYIRNNVKDNEIIVFSKPRLLAFYTGKQSMNISWTTDAAANRQHFDSIKVSYLLFCDHLNLGIISEFKNLQPALYVDSVRINDAYILYRLKSGVAAK